MKLQDIKAILAERTPAHLDSLYEAYFREHPQAHMEQFLASLYDQSLITTKDLQELHLLEPIEVTQIDMLSQSHLLHQQLSNTQTTLQTAEAYEFLGVLGQGAMGLVYKAKDRNLQRTVAYKQLLHEMTHNRSVLRRFLNEVQITAQLDHPNIVPIYNLDVRPDGSLAYAMKMVKGKTLKELLQEARDIYNAGQLPGDEHRLETLLEHFLKVCDAMAYAHSKHVIHRDLKPANIMIGKYKEVYVMDWGIAKLYQHPQKEGDIDLREHISDDLLGEATQTGQIVGTPRYMSPQQAAGKNQELDSRSDQFSLGLILYEIVTLMPAFKANQSMELLKKVLKAEIEPFIPFHPKIQVPEGLRAIIRKATARKPNQRYASTAAFAQDIRRYLRGEELEARPDSRLRKILRCLQEHRRQAGFAVMGVLVLSALITLATTWLRQQEIQASRWREARLSAHLTQLARQSQTLDSEFLKMERLLEKLAAAASFALQGPAPATGRLYFNPDFASAQHQPPDFGPAPAYHRSISTDWAGIKLAPGVSQAAVRTQLAQLQQITPVLQSIFRESVSPPLSPASFDRTLRQQGLPLVWAYLGLESGIHFAYPGKGGYKPEYDPRQRPWYLKAGRNPRSTWGEPYLDASGQGLLIPCVRALFSDSQQFLGVAGIELSLEKWSQRFLQFAKQGPVENMLLLNQKGEIVVNAAQTTQALSLKPYPSPALLEALKHQDSGYLHLAGPPARLLAFNRLSSIGWILVVEAQTEILFRKQP